MSSEEDYGWAIGRYESWQDGVDDQKNFRKGEWKTSDGRRFLIRDMSDWHLLNAYKRTQDKRLFEEMVLRLFEDRIK